MKRKYKKSELRDKDLLEASLNEGFGVNPVGQQPSIVQERTARKHNRRK